MRTFFLGALATLAVVALGVWVAASAGLVPVNADGAPPALERWLARTAVVAGVERRMAPRPNPRSGEAAVLDGIRVYTADCETCHGGANGTPGAIARGLYQAPPQFAKQGFEQVPYGYTAWVVAHGIRLTAMPSFARSLTQRQIDDVTSFLQRMNALTPNERYAWERPQRRTLLALYRAIGGTRSCVYVPHPGAVPHHFQTRASFSNDGAFVVEDAYNRFIAELSVLGFDEAHQRYVRARITKDGAVDVAVSHGATHGAWLWTSKTDPSGPPTSTTIAMRPDGSYAFRSTDRPGSGECAPPSDGAR